MKKTKKTALTAAAFAAAIADIPTNAIQVAGSTALFIILGGAFDKSGLKHNLNKSAHII